MPELIRLAKQTSACLFRGGIASLRFGRLALRGAPLREGSYRRACIASLAFPPSLRDGLAGLRPTRGDWQKLEPAATVQPFVVVFMHGPDPHLTRIGGIADRR
jgi:hypothetical protein